MASASKFNLDKGEKIFSKQSCVVFLTFSLLCLIFFPIIDLRVHYTTIVGILCIYLLALRFLHVINQKLGWLQAKILCCHSPIGLAFFALLLLHSFTCWYVLLPLAHVYPPSQTTTFMILTLISQFWFLNVVFIKFPTPYGNVNMKPKSNINDLYVVVGSLVEYASSSLWSLM